MSVDVRLLHDEVRSRRSQGAVDRLFADVDLVLSSRALADRASLPTTRFATTDARAKLIQIIEDTLEGRSRRARLEAFTVAERLYEPLARLTRGIEAPLTPTTSWRSVSPDAAATLLPVLEALKSQIETPHLVLLLRLLEAVLTASSEVEWARAEALAAEQNQLAMASAERVVVFASLFWTGSGTAWPAIYLVEKDESAQAGADRAALERVARFFTAIEPARGAPALCFATRLLYCPEKAEANAFALHNQAALIFEVLDPARRALFDRLASRFGLEHHEAARLGRVFLAGHEFGHKYDPLNLPRWTEELFADVAGFVAYATAMGGEATPDTLLKVLIVESLVNYARPVSEAPSALYFESTDQFLTRLQAIGAITINLDAVEPTMTVDLGEGRWERVLADFAATFSSMRQGQCPEHLRPGIGSATLAKVREQVKTLIRYA